MVVFFIPRVITVVAEYVEGVSGTADRDTNKRSIV
jgi:hypothetical protein